MHNIQLATPFDLPALSIRYNFRKVTAAAEEITKLLHDVTAGKAEAEEKLFSAVYQELHKLAERRFSAERCGHTLQATALVHEVYLSVFERKDKNWKDRNHFFSVAARGMRRILIDYARHNRAAKRGGGQQTFQLEGMEVSTFYSFDELIAVDAGLLRLYELDPRQVRIVEMRFFGGLTDDEIADVLEISPRTVKRDWKLAKAWLHAELGK